MVKCDICGSKVEELFLDKIDGTYIKKKNKLKAVCSNCQRKYKDNILDQI